MLPLTTGPLIVADQDVADRNLWRRVRGEQFGQRPHEQATTDALVTPGRASRPTGASRGDRRAIERWPTECRSLITPTSVPFPQLDLFGKELLAVDGTRIKAVNNKDRNFTRAWLADQKLDDYLQRLDTTDAAEQGTPGSRVKDPAAKIAAVRDRHTAARPGFSRDSGRRDTARTVAGLGSQRFCQGLRQRSGQRDPAWV